MQRVDGRWHGCFGTERRCRAKGFDAALHFVVVEWRERLDVEASGGGAVVPSSGAPAASRPLAARLAPSAAALGPRATR
jgi:hypothetical protein